jgi:hypothetical protein
VLNRGQIQTAHGIIEEFVTVFGMEVAAEKTVLLNLRSTTTPTFQFCTQQVKALPKTAVVKSLGVYISGSREAIQQQLETNLSADLSQLSVYDLDPAARALIGSHKLVPRYAYRLALYANDTRCIKNLQDRMVEWIRDGGTKRLSGADHKAVFTSRKQGGLGVHRLDVRIRMQLVCLVYKNLQTYPPNHPLHKTNRLFRSLVHTPDTTHMNVVHTYKVLLQDCAIQSPILKQTLITEHFQATTTTAPDERRSNDWLITKDDPAPAPQPLPANLPSDVMRTLSDAEHFAGEVVYTDGSQKDGQAGSSFYFPCTGLVWETESSWYPNLRARRNQRRTRGTSVLRTQQATHGFK